MESNKYVNNLHNTYFCRLNFRAVPSTPDVHDIMLQFRALDLKNIEKGALGLGRTDPYLEISKKYSYPSQGTFHQQGKRFNTMSI